MLNYLCGRRNHLSLLCSLGLGLSAGIASASDLQGTVQQQVVPGSASSKVLHGGVDEKGTLNPSLKVIPGIPGNGQPLGGHLIQFSGSTQKGDGQNVPLNKMTPSSSGVTQGGVWSAAANQATHVIPPISSYTLTPQNGITTYVPGHEVLKPSTQKGIGIYVPGYTTTTSSVSVQKGVTAYAPGYEVTNITARAGMSPVDFRGGPGANSPLALRGISFWAPGYEVNSVKVDPVSNTSSIIATGGIKTVPPSFHCSVTSSQTGVICWSPGYEVTVQKAGIAKETLGGLYTVSNTPPVELKATPGKLPPDRILIQTEIVPPMLASAKLLPGVHVQTSACWDDWYKNVASLIYARWQQADVGPGVADVRVTITRARTISCELAEFVPAPDLARDVTAETSFREAAVRAAKNVYGFEIPEFPPDAQQEQVTFDVQLKRTVDGPLGYKVASTGTPADISMPAPAVASPSAPPPAAPVQTGGTGGGDNALKEVSGTVTTPKPAVEDSTNTKPKN